jgi:hypothetical protein
MSDLSLFDSSGDGGREVVPFGETVFIDFDGGQVAVVLVEGEPMPILRLANDVLTLSWPAQYRKVQEDPAICVAEIRTQLPGDRQSRTVVTTDLDGFGLWLAKINANKVAPEARDLVITWQRKAARAIRERFFGPVASASAQPAVLDRRALALMVIEAEDRADAEKARAEAALTVVKELAQPANLWQKLADSGATIEVGVAAKLLAKNGVDTGRNRLYDLLRAWRWVFQRTREPRQQAVTAGYVAAEMGKAYTDETTGERKTGASRTRITVKGLELLAEHFGITLRPQDVERLADIPSHQIGA